MSAAVQWSFFKPTCPDCVYFLSVFGDWQPGTALTTLVNGQLVGGTQTHSNTFTFQAPTTPGIYRIRIPIVLAYAPVTNFYGGPAGGQYSPGTGQCYTEITFRVANAWQYNFQSFAGLSLSGPPGNYLIEANTNLGTTNWITLTNIQVSTTPYFWVDINSPNYPQRFYLAVPAP